MKNYKFSVGGLLNASSLEKNTFFMDVKLFIVKKTKNILLLSDMTFDILYIETMYIA